MGFLREEGVAVWRGLVRRPVWVATAILTLALGVGATTTLYSVVASVLLRPLPWPEADRLVRLWEHHPGARSQLSQPMIAQSTVEAWRASAAGRGGQTSLEGLATWGVGNAAVRLGGELSRERVATVSPELFGLLRTPPAQGRWLVAADAVVGAPPAVVVADGFWRTQLGAAPTVLGQALVLDGVSHEIVGVAPPGFDFPTRDITLYRAEALSPLKEGEFRLLSALGRLAPGVTAAQAAAEGTAAARSGTRPLAAELLLGKGAPVEVEVRGWLAEMTAPVRPALAVLSVGVALLFLVAAANVANLLLSYGLDRRRELAVRSALGGSAWQLRRPVLLESLGLALAGGGGGLMLAATAIELLPSLAPASLPRLEGVRLDGFAVALALGLSVLAVFVANLAPLLRFGRGSLLPQLATGGKGAVGERGGRVRNGLLVLEAALSVVLLVGSVLLGRSFVRLLEVDPGYEREQVLTARLLLAEAEAGERIDPASVETLLARLRAVPGVVAAGAGNMAPFVPMTAVAGTHLPWPGPDGQPVEARVLFYRVTPGYAEALGLRHLEGRWPTAAGATPGTGAAYELLVNESFVRSYVPAGEKVVGRLLPGAFVQDGEVSEIVGVVGDVRKDSLEEAPRPEVYAAAGGPAPWSTALALVVRTEGDPVSLAPTLRQLVGETDRRWLLEGLGPLTQQISRSTARPRFAVTVLGVFSSVAVVLTAIGLYGALAYAVSLRRRELGVRAVLGAGGGELARLVLRRGLGVTLAGAVLGVAAAALLSRSLEALLFGVESSDPISFVVAPLLLLGVSVLACWVPARRAAQADPAVALRAE